MFTPASGAPGSAPLEAFNPHFLRNTFCTLAVQFSIIRILNEHPATDDPEPPPMTEKTGGSRDMIFTVEAKSNPDTHVTEWCAPVTRVPFTTSFYSHRSLFLNRALEP